MLNCTTPSKAAIAWIGTLLQWIEFLITNPVVQLSWQEYDWIIYFIVWVYIWFLISVFLTPLHDPLGYDK